MKLVIFIVSLFICAGACANEQNVYYTFENVQKDTKVLLDKCTSPLWSRQTTYSDSQMAQITSDENKCLKTILLDLMNENFSLPKQQQAKLQILKSLDSLEENYQTVYRGMATQSNRCVSSEEDIFSCGTAAVMIAPSMWQKQLKEMISFIYSYSHGY